MWMAPSVLTIGALLSGLTAVRYAAENEFDWSVKCVLAAAILDGLDGHVARALGTSSDIGFELDSLCDLANFGVMPTFIVYFWVKSLPDHGCIFEACRKDHFFIWFACCTYAGCCAYRLARFNVAGKKAEMDAQLPVQPPRIMREVSVRWWHNLQKPKLYFQGVPAPVAAAYALSPMMLRMSSLSSLFGNLWVVITGSWIIFTGVLMVAPLRTLSSKMLKSDRDATHLKSVSTCSAIVKWIIGITFLGFAGYFIFDVCLVLVMLHFFSLPIGSCLFQKYAANSDADKSD